MTQQPSDPVEDRLNKPIEICKAFAQLLPGDQFDLYAGLFKLFSSDDQESLLELLHERHQEENDGDADGEEDDE